MKPYCIIYRKSPRISSQPIVGPSYRTTMELRSVSPSILFCSPSLAYSTTEDLKDQQHQQQPMSTAVILQRFWKLSVLLNNMFLHLFFTWLGNSTDLVLRHRLAIDNATFINFYSVLLAFHLRLFNAGLRASLRFV